ncbi:acyl-CoA dehydrogenase [Virgisporangium aliadipatigenens]|uniref:Acyl-CoA dehydrogenase n=1 Tax=Virgisporangium aliadipatigenens TaxID=741659 RepID=A0A8J3YHX4_9ACTN|nr:acyl-CoA dehydrogenase family protein [Virgisporangium aliadipatigenens]GIJ45599.1 acyl-CoA dehydrogenase [Virgisporangium aliadipatigenens]
MPRFVQQEPRLCDPYGSDPVLAGWLARALGADGHAAAEKHLVELSADAAGPLREAHRDAEEHPPVLRRYDGWGARVDRVETAPGWETLRRAAARHAIVALPYLPQARRTWGAGARVVQHALLHVFGPESATFTCPVAMADGAAALLSRPEVDGGPWLERLTSTDPDTAVTSGQWMTESQGGSDISRTDTVAHPDGGTGTWRLTGEKWFCSAIDSAMAVALARPEGAGGGSRVLAPFLVPRAQEGVRLHRLKEKLGTRAVPTAEVALERAEGVPLGDPRNGGLSRMMTLVVVTRLHNAAAAAAGMARGLAYARDYAERRLVAGPTRLADSPLHRATLGAVEVDAAAAFVLASHAFALLGRVEVDGDAEAADRLRIVAPLAKLATAKLAVAAASELVESFGGAGFVEDTGLPRLLRDAQVLPIWEGTTNVLSLDVLRALSRGEGMSAVPAGLRDEVTAAAKDPTAAHVVAGARGLAMRVAFHLAAEQLEAHGEARHAELWRRGRIEGADIAADLAVMAGT